jgi:hypothetical protein
MTVGCRSFHSQFPRLEPDIRCGHLRRMRMQATARNRMRQSDSVAAGAGRVVRCRK